MAEAHRVTRECLSCGKAFWGRADRRQNYCSMACKTNFMDKFIPEPNSGCWLWLGGTDGVYGYGKARHNGRQAQAHRVSYELFKGPIPGGDAA